MTLDYDDVMKSVCSYCVYKCSPMIDCDQMYEYCDACDARFKVWALFFTGEKKEQ